MRSVAAPATHEAAALADPAPPFDRTAHSTTDPGSIWVIVNKSHPVMPSDFRPEIYIVRGYQVATAAAGPLGRLLDAADAAAWASRSPARSARTATRQRPRGHRCGPRRAEADLVSARAGYSEHQTGLAVDLITPDGQAATSRPAFARTPGGSWLARNAWRFGFVVRYQPETTAVTGDSPEPWHLRYVGGELAGEMHRPGSPPWSSSSACRAVTTRATR